LIGYLDKFKLRLKPSNTALLRELVLFVEAVIRFLHAHHAQHSPRTSSSSSTSSDSKSPAGVSPQSSITTTPSIPIAPAKSSSSTAALTDNVSLRGNVFTVNEFALSAGIDQLNLFQLLRFIEQAQLVKKLNGYLDKYADTDLVDIMVHPYNIIPTSSAHFHFS
jgi:hypothetical protein